MADKSAKLPIKLLRDLVRGYTSDAQLVVPQFLELLFDILRDGQSRSTENVSGPLASMPGFEAMQAQQAAF